MHVDPVDPEWSRGWGFGPAGGEVGVGVRETEESEETEETERDRGDVCARPRPFNAPQAASR